MGTFPGHHTRDCAMDSVEDILYYLSFTINHTPFMYDHSFFPPVPKKIISFFMTTHLQPYPLILPCAFTHQHFSQVGLIFFKYISSIHFFLPPKVFSLLENSYFPLPFSLVLQKWPILPCCLGNHKNSLSFLFKFIGCQAHHLTSIFPVFVYVSCLHSQCVSCPSTDTGRGLHLLCSMALSEILV